MTLTTKLYNERLKNGLCPKCGGQRDRWIYCQKCLDKINAIINQHKANKKEWKAYLKRERTYRKRIRSARRINGLCTSCGRDREDTRFRMCQRCRDKQAKKNRTLRSK